MNDAAVALPQLPTRAVPTMRRGRGSYAACRGARPRRGQGRARRASRHGGASGMLACRAAADPPRNMAEAAAAYAGDGGFADRARHALQSGDAIPEVARGYAMLREAAAARREDENRAFADVLRAWNEGGGWGTDPVPVERLLEKVVAPLAHDAPALVLVLDGLSFPTWRALAETFRGWVGPTCVREGAMLHRLRSLCCRA